MTTPTIHDVAREAGVSIKTVSRVVNGETNVRSGTAQAVQAAIDKLDYHPNRAARTLRTGIHDTIGLVVDSLSDPFFAQMTEVVQAEAVRNGMDVVVASTGLDSRRARAQVDRLARQGVAGLIFAPVGDDAVLSRWLPRHVPLVLLDRPVTTAHHDIVRVDDAAGASAAVAHLVSHGHRRIAFVGDVRGLATIHDRLVAYCTALEAAGIEVDPYLVETASYDRTTSMPFTTAVLALEDPPTAILAATPLAGEGVVAALTALGRRREVAVVVFGDFPLADLLDPPMTVVDQDPAGLAREAVRRLLEQVSGTSGARETVVLRTRLVARGSGEIPGPYAAEASR